MNAYSTRGQARIQQHDITTVLRTHRYMAGASLAALERQRGGHVAAEEHRLLKQNGISPNATAALVAPMRQAIGSALVRIGRRVQGASQGKGTPDTTATPGTLSVAS